MYVVHMYILNSLYQSLLMGREGENRIAAPPRDKEISREFGYISDICLMEF